MITATPPASDRSPARTPSAIERWLRPNALVLIGIWLFAALHFYDVWPTLGVVFRDTDDIMRMVEVGDFLKGQGWFDLHQYRLDPPADLPMHWSRFVDLPIALLIRFFGLFLAPETALRAAMFVWPALPLLPVLWASRFIAVRLGGDWAAFPAVYLLATLAFVLAQFVPGRVDHHNVQIMLTFLLLAAFIGLTGVRKGVAVGIACAAAMAIGMETLPFQLIAASAFALRWVWLGDDDGEATAFGISLASGMVVAAGVTLPPSEWLRGACDAISINYVGLAVVGGLGLAAIGLVPVRSPTARAILLGIVAIAAVAAFAAPERACLRGPFGQILPEVRAVWLDAVKEIQPWPVVFAEGHVTAILAVVTPILALGAIVHLARQDDLARSSAFWVLVASMVVSFVIGLTQLRTLTYANALAVPLIAAAIGRLARDTEKAGGTVTVAVLAGAVLTNSMVLQLGIERVVPAAWKAEADAQAGEGLSSSLSQAVTGAVNSSGTGGAAVPAGSPCQTMTSYAELAKLPRGLVASDTDIGPAILFATHHSVIAAPYHRMQRGIIDSARILHRPPTEAMSIMAAREVDYLAVCTAAKPGADDGGIDALLRAGRVPAGLEEIPGNGIIRVFRVHARPLLTQR